MASGHRFQGVDFDDLFDPDVIGNGPTAPGYRANGQPLRYAHIQYGSKGPNVGRRQAGADISNLWARKGSAVYTLPFDGKSYLAYAQAPTGGTVPPTASMTLVLESNGSWYISRSVNGSISGNGTLVLDSGTWLPAGQSASDYQVQFSGSSSGGGSVNNGAASPQPLTTSRSISITASVPAASSSAIDATLNANCALTRVSAGVTTNSSCVLNAGCLGYL